MSDGAPRIAAVILAAGCSSRTAPHNKLLALYDGRPQLRRIAEAALGAGAVPVCVVLGHAAAALQPCLDGLDVEILVNDHYCEGLSSSVKLGFAQASAGRDGVLMIAADQPLLTKAHLARLIRAFRRGGIVVATDGGARRSPVILPVGMAAAVAALSGDEGARRLVAGQGETVGVELGDAASHDTDTIEAVVAAGGYLPSQPK